MKRLVMTTALASALTAGTAFADCNVSMDAVSKEYGDFVRSESRTNAEMRGIVRNLRDSAMRLNNAGMTEACETVVQAMGDVISGYREAAGEKTMTEKAAGTEKPADENKEVKAEADMTEEEKAERAKAEADMTEEQKAERAKAEAEMTEEQKAERAKAMEAERAEAENTRAQTVRAEIEARVVEIDRSNMTIDSSELVGINIYNYANEFIGEIDGLLMQSGEAPSHFIVSHGGFWNIGDKEAAVPIDMFKWDPEWEVYYVDITEEQIENAPDYDLVNGQWTKDVNDDYYTKISVKE